MMYAKQAGASGLGMLCYIFAGLFAFMVAMKLVPVYADNFTVGSILSSLDDRLTIRDASVQDVRNWITKGFQVNGIRDVPEEAIKVRQEGRFLTAHVNYERRVDLFANIDVVMTFENSWKIKQQ